MSPLRSFIDVPVDHDFPIQNLPYSVFRSKDGNRPCVAIGDYILDLATLESEGLLQTDQNYFDGDTLNAFMEAGPSVWRVVRDRLQELLSSECEELRENGNLKSRTLHDRLRAHLVLPVTVGDYTDFYSSREHATNVGTMFRGADKALMENWLHLPVGYHGRASSIVVSGTDIHRPKGQLKPENEPPVHGPSMLMDFELEMGFFVGPGNPLGHPIDVQDAEDHIFGLVLVNDWSARDIQKWEYVPLGPFLGKSFATTISPWIITLDALAPFRCAGPAQDPTPLPYLNASKDGAFDIVLEVGVQSSSMTEPSTVCRSNYRYLYWSAAQQLAHHTVNGCNSRPGDLMASGTISGPTPDSYGSMLEISWRGSKPLTLSNGEERKFIQDGDQVIVSGFAQGADYRIGFGEAAGTLLPAL
ncbi:MAG: fumarylacetoacetase [Rhodothermia bacterium]|nr:MAG: fumarylacetoacetase [Rhodothermia bacterium]